MLTKLPWAFSVVTFVVFASARSANAQPHGVRLTHSGDPARSVSVSWNSDNASDDSVIYGTSPAALTETHPADEHHAQPAPLTNAFSAQLTGLDPITTYYYRVGRPGAYHPPDGEPPLQFTTLTADACQPMTFIVMGDNRADVDGPGVSDRWSDILSESLLQGPQLYVNTGDMVKNGDVPNEWAAFIDASEVGWAAVPSILTIGNHDEDDVDGDGAMYNQLFAHPRNSQTDTEDYYSIDVGPIHFVSLNANAGGTEFTDMVSWLDADLGATDRPWKMVFFHHAIYSRGNHSSGEEEDSGQSGYLNAGLIPVFDRHDVDLVFNGHSHNYERFVPSLGVDVEFGGTGRSFPAGDRDAIDVGDPIPDGATGTTYIVTGGAGAQTTDVFGFTCENAACSFCLPGGININCPAEVFDNDQNAYVTYDGRHNYVVVHVDTDTLDVEVWTTTRQMIGTQTPEMIDQFTITTAKFPSGICGPTGGTPDAGPTGGPADAASPNPADAASPNPADAGNPPSADAVVNGDPDGGPAVTDGDGAGCCSVSSRVETGNVVLWLAVALGIATMRRRRRKSR